MIKAEGISLSIRNRQLLDQISIEIPVGQITAVMGPNGAGKSSLLKVLSKELIPQFGQVFYNGEDGRHIGTCMLSRIRAVMAQHSHVVFPFSAEKIVELGAISHEKSRHKAYMVQEVMELTDTWKFKDRLVQELSGGERQRVHFARVLLQIWENKPYPRYLLLDEPTSSMDVAQQHQLLQIASSLKERNIGIMAVLHDLNLAAQYADRIVLMRHGKLIKSGAINDVMQNKYLEQTYKHPLSVIENPENGQPIIISGYSQTEEINKIQTA